MCFPYCRRLHLPRWKKDTHQEMWQSSSHVITLKLMPKLIQNQMCDSQTLISTKHACFFWHFLILLFLLAAISYSKLLLKLYHHQRPLLLWNFPIMNLERRTMLNAQLNLWFSHFSNLPLISFVQVEFQYYHPHVNFTTAVGLKQSLQLIFQLHLVLPPLLWVQRQVMRLRRVNLQNILKTSVWQNQILLHQ